jgi:hypothetical protein
VLKWLSNLHYSGGLHEKVLEMMLDEVEQSALIEDAYVRDTCSLKTSWPTILSGPAVLHLPSHCGSVKWFELCGKRASALSVGQLEGGGECPRR